EAFEPNLLDEQTVFENGREYTIRVYEYLFKPEKEMKVSLQPSFSYFSPEEEQYVTLSDETYEINILPDNKSPLDLSDDSPLKVHAGSKSDQTGFSTQNIFIYLGILLAGLFIALILLFMLKKEKTKEVKPKDN